MQLEKELADARALADRFRAAASLATAQLQEELESRSLLEQELQETRAELQRQRASSAEQEEREQVELIMERTRCDTLQRQLTELQSRLDTEMQLRCVLVVCLLIYLRLFVLVAALLLSLCVKCGL